MFFWELVIATDSVDVDHLLPLFGQLDSRQSPEATSVLFQLLKTSDPTLEIFKHVVQRRVDDPVTRALFIHWTCTAGESKMTQLFTKLLNQASLGPTTTAKKIKYNESLASNAKKLTAEQQLEMIATQKKSSASFTATSSGSSFSAQSSGNGGLFSSSFARSKDCDGAVGAMSQGRDLPGLEQVLAHLNKLRLVGKCCGFIMKESLLDTLKKVYRKHCDEEMRKKYAELFLLADEFNNCGESECENEEEEVEEEEDDANEDDDEESDGNHNRKGGRFFSIVHTGPKTSIKIEF